MFGRFFTLTIISLFASVHFVNLKAEESIQIKDFNLLKEKSYLSSKNYLSKESEKKQASFNALSSLDNHLPSGEINFKKTKDYYSSNSPLLNSLGLASRPYSWSVDYYWPIFNHSLFIKTEKSLNQKKLKDLEYEIYKKSYDVEFQTQYLNLLLSLYKKETISNSITKAETAKKEAEIAFNLGQKTKIDVLRSEANLVSLNSKRLGILDEVEKNLNTIVALSGLRLEDFSQVLELKENEIFNLLNLLSKTDAPLTQANFNESALLKKQELEINDLRYSSKLITTKHWPELKLQGSLEHSGMTFDNSLHRPSRSHSMAVVLSFPFFLGGSIVSSNFEQYHALKTLEYNKELQKLELNNQFKSQLKQFEALLKMDNSLKINIDQFEELYRLSRTSYQLGKTSLIELLEVQDNLINSKIEYAKNKINLYQLISNYNWQIGRL